MEKRCEPPEDRFRIVPGSAECWRMALCHLRGGSLLAFGSHMCTLGIGSWSCIHVLPAQANQVQSSYDLKYYTVAQDLKVSFICGSNPVQAGIADCCRYLLRCKHVVLKGQWEPLLQL